MTEEEVLNYYDMLADFGSAIQQYGARKVMLDFQTHFPDLYEELKAQINRAQKKPMAVLLKKPDATGL